ncbi:EamA-like transporter family protein [Monaibacterium marinum]|uniref:EamA-like transporter family protein n=2 Tax=Pontivivens marinum TaxID=1690039 RepID=A0A2C9CQR1_9RHOB|nr:EamA-like transporter family protein [Monaibacterium marinum]
MRLFMTICLVLIFFAANSVLTRAGLVEGGISPAAFTAIRLAAGAAMLAIIVGFQGYKPWSAASPSGAASLYLYAVMLSFAYIAIPTGLGALILFGAVQITMFAGAVIKGQQPSARRWIGSLFGVLGLAVLGAPGADSPPLWAAVLMALSGVAWGLYSLIGAKGADPTRATAGNFLFAAPLGLLTWLFFPGQTPEMNGIIMAVASGAISSGIGYALWYSVLPRLDATVAALAQLSVPLIALAGGMIFLAEPPDLTFALSAILILGGIALGLSKSRKKLP